MLNGTPRNMSALRWYSWQESFPSCTSNWNRAWQGASAICGMSAGCQAETTRRRDSGLVRSCSVASASWAIAPPPGGGQARHGAPRGGAAGAEAAVPARPPVPDARSALLLPAHVGVPAQEPQQLEDDRAGVHPLGGDQREALGQVVADLAAEQAACAGAGAVALG